MARSIANFTRYIPHATGLAYANPADYGSAAVEAVAFIPMVSVGVSAFADQHGSNGWVSGYLPMTVRSDSRPLAKTVAIDSPHRRLDKARRFIAEISRYP